MTVNRIELYEGDITSLDVDALVNAANNSLLGGGGVDGAIHKAAGPGMLEECIKIGGCLTGEAKLTGGYMLKARHVIHTVGPVWRGGIEDEHELLASCYQSCLKIAADLKISTVAIPGISTGIYGFPKDQAAMIAVTETKRFLSKSLWPAKVIFVTFDSDSHRIYSSLLNSL